jgi:Bacterial Ig-like domain (group 3)/FG-GAP-like repeat/FG-GAP repeat
MRSRRSVVFLCILFLLGSFTASFLSAETFRNPYRIPTPFDPASLVVGDINGDGLPDILWGDVSTSPYTMRILLARPGGGYVPAPGLQLPANTGVGCYVADFNKDGRGDLICAASYEFSSWLRVFLGNGDGTFQSAITTALPVSNGNYAQPNLYVPADINNDGISDVLMVDLLNSYNGGRVLLGDGRGGFGPPLPLTIGPNLVAPIVADLNGDGKVDLFWANGPAVSLGKGDGTFSGPFSYIGASYFDASCVLHDMDGDGHPDAVCGYEETNTGDISGASDQIILHGNPDGSFNTTPIAKMTFGDHDNEYDGFGTYQTPIAVVDLNGDGVPDVLASSGDGLAVLLGGPNLTFSYPLHYAVATTGYNTGVPIGFQAQIADLNGDGVPDVISTGPNGLYILYGQHGGTYISAAAPEVTEVIGYASVADFNGDGIPDVVATGDSAVKLSLGKGDGTFAAPVALPNNSGAINFSTPLSVINAHILHGDFNGDGKQDIIAMGSPSIYSYLGYLLLGHGDGTFTAPVSVPEVSSGNALYAPFSDAAVHDINHDGRDDIVVMNSGALQTGQLESLISNPGGTTFTVVTTPVLTDSINSSFYYTNTQPAIADFNRDGKLDAVYGGLGNMYVVNGNGDGSFASTALALPIPVIGGTVSQGAIAVAAGDFDGDGNQDFVALVQFGTGQFPYPSNFATAALVYYGDGNGTFSLPVIAGLFDRNYTGIAVSDLNLDGLADIVVKTSGSLGGGNSVGVVHAQASRSFGQEVNYTAGKGLSSLSITDLNGDGYPDLVFANGDYNGAASSVTVLLNSGPAATITGTLVATPEPSVVTTAFNLTATLAPPVGGVTPAGSIAFYIDAQLVGSSALSGNVATIAGPTTLAVGLHELTAIWNGDSNYAPVSLTGSHMVTAVPLQITLGSSPNASVAGQSVTFTTQFVPNPPAGVTLTGQPYSGTLTFYDGTTVLGQQQVSTVGFNFTTAGLRVGSHNITAVYSGDTAFAGATSNVVVQVVNGLSSVATLVAAPLTTAFGVPVQLTATVAAASLPGAGVPTGTVAFSQGGVSFQSGTLAGGVASVSTTGLVLGSNTLSCVYSGDGTYNGSNCNTLIVNVTPDPSTISLAASPNPGYAGQTVTLTATVSVVTPLPIGTVTFVDGSTAIGTSVMSAKGLASLTTASLTVGTHMLTATFNPGVPFISGSTSSVVQEVILPSSFTVTLVPSTITVQDGQQGTAGIQLASVGTFAGPLTLTYGVLPQYGAAAIAPTTVTLTAGGSASSSIVFKTVATTNVASKRVSSGRWPVSLATVLMLVPFGWLRRRRLAGLLGVVFAALALQALTGCGDQFYYLNFVAPGTYQIPVTATDSNHVSQTASLTVVVTKSPD